MNPSASPGEVKVKQSQEELLRSHVPLSAMVLITGGAERSIEQSEPVYSV